MTQPSTSAQRKTAKKPSQQSSKVILDRNILNPELYIGSLGDEAFGIPNMKPLKLEEVELDAEDHLRARFSECNVYGLDTAEIKDIK